MHIDIVHWQCLLAFILQLIMVDFPCAMENKKISLRAICLQHNNFRFSGTTLKRTSRLHSETWDRSPTLLIWLWSARIPCRKSKLTSWSCPVAAISSELCLPRKTTPTLWSFWGGSGKLDLPMLSTSSTMGRWAFHSYCIVSTTEFSSFDSSKITPFFL